MDKTKLLGGVLLIVGILLAWHGFRELDSLEHRIWSMFNHAPKAPYFEFVVAVIAVVLGSVLLLKKR